MLEDVWNIELDSLPLHDDRYVKPKVRAYGDKIYTNFRVLSVLENGVEFESFTGSFIELLLVFHKKNFWKYIYTIVLIILLTSKWLIICNYF